MPRRHNKQLLFCAITCLGALLGLLIVGLFYLAEPEAVEAAARHIFGGASGSGAPFSLPQRERPVEVPSKGGRFSGKEGKPNWFGVDNIEFHSAILIAGSHGYQNYRHQADVCHAFQILRAGGMPAARIITFVFDDIAHHPRNPYPGQIFNRPGGENVYPGCAKDYTGWDVNADNVLAVLKGNENAVRGKGSGRVLQRDPSHRVFLYYSDHGSVGNIAMPVGRPLFADELHETLDTLVETNHFNEMVIYLEACDAGSMFRGFAMEGKNRILAVAAADAYESSYASYCPDYGYQTRVIVPNATHIGSCMGDLFSVAWMEDTANADRSEVLIEEQIERVRYRTSSYETFLYGSHVKEYGDKDTSIRKQVIGNFLSYFTAPSGWTRSDALEVFGSVHNKAEMPVDTPYSQRDADLMALYKRAYQNNDVDAAVELDTELQKRWRVDNIIRDLLYDLIQQNKLSEDSSIEVFATQEVMDNPDQPVVMDWGCLRMMVRVFEEECMELDDYSRQYTRTFANLCNVGVEPSGINPALQRLC